ncbi:hypothetical protein [Flavobacterium litorale]|uniref:Uncharacterized protein n=1 Tax=Flavobacterium litorale TaxID=2856519 RepID=A0ABX8VCI7_9FLAO|nr:hypothetical protein [Flavobacterium litorale]QYJ68893.1 hypothetical protein K1I41_03140 [Flavobacterium litorale]
MKTEALITMVLAQGFVIAMAGYFFYKVLTTKPKQEPDSYSENDDVTDRQE